MSTTPVGTEDQQPPPTDVQVAQQAYTASSGTHGSIGPFIGALAVITILVAIAIMIGRLCSGRRVIGKRQYDFEGWVETKFASCIDGRLDPPPPSVPSSTRRPTPPPRDDAAAEEEEEEQRESGGEQQQQQERA
ncbi:uncharacterized protein LOC124910742 [Impatiens glandulifera]|uniref:uncharacterized protein LOC124910742 n=1 Tax=Impatiens glandulifera TaxID=253017 RepID=UPI001FB12EE5|nr:uncharacterized protein LOC124910742 [Impatiens glandulifera]